MSHVPDENQFAPTSIDQTIASIEINRQSNVKAKEIPIVSALIERKYDGVLKIMAKNGGADPNQVFENGKTILHYATEYSTDEQFFRLLLEHGANVNAITKDNQLTPLHFAAKSNKTSFGQLLIEWGADVNLTTKHGQSPLIMATLYNSTTWPNC